MHTITENIEIRVVGAPVANALNTDNNSGRIDMAAYECVTFIAPITDSTATGVAALTIESNDADSDAGMAAVAGSVSTMTCAVNDDINDRALVTEIRNPSKRYVQAVRTSLTANIAFGSVIALLTPRRLPVADHTTALDVTRVSD